MKLLTKNLLAWCSMLAIVFAGAMVDDFEEWGRLLNMLCRGISALLCILSFSLFRKELTAGSRMVFLNFAVFFGSTALATPLFQLLRIWVIPTDQWTRFYFYEYDILGYFALLLTSVLFLVINHIGGRGRVWQKYIATLLLVCVVTVYLFGPLISDPMYLMKTPELRNVKAVHTAIKQLRLLGNNDPSLAQIASFADLQASKNELIEGRLSKEQRLASVQEALPYTQNDNVYMLLYRPLWRSCVGMSLLMIIALLFLIAYKYVKDSPEGAYMEKIAWCLLPYSCFEALHHFVYSTTQSYSLFVNVATIGVYLSITLMCLLCFLFGLRLHFVFSVEGRYYERRLIESPNGITRWRDAVDNWLVKQFFNTNMLDRRFLINRKSKNSV